MESYATESWAGRGCVIAKETPKRLLIRLEQDCMLSRRPTRDKGTGIVRSKRYGSTGSAAIDRVGESDLRTAKVIEVGFIKI
jgi:hypothetical protein